MTSCGACKFLRRKCHVKDCVFAPYFSHDQGAAHFAAIHKVFGASNASKLLAHLPTTDRSEAAVTISYEAQARVQDPIYGCVSHIFALQHQVMNLQVQLASLKEQAAQCIINNTTNPNDHESHSLPHDVQTWLKSFQNQVTMPQLEANMPYYTKFENPGFREENYTSFGSTDSVELQPNKQFQDDADELQSVALRYLHLS
ncbi:hypothetical protein ACS0TY_013173 [Phlomoides rotata]